MARMIPEQISSKVSSNAERRLFARFKDELPRTWIVLHSLGLSTHATKPWAEIDFVVVSPHGVCCIEVKGGRIARRRGQWVFTDRFGNETLRPEGPFQQVAGAATALYQFIESQRIANERIQVSYGVATPDIRFDVEGPDIEKEVIFDERDLDGSIEQYIQRIWKYWGREKMGRKPDRPRQPLSDKTISTTVALLRGDFDRVPTLRARIDEARDELTALTEEQYRVLDGLADNERQIVSGPAGTGKTLLAAEEARRRAAAGDRVLLVCFNRNLAVMLRGVVAASSTVDAVHAHGWMADLIERAGLKARLPKAEADDLFRVFYPELALEALLVLDRCGRYDTLILDEAQDLLQEKYLDLFDAVLRGGIRNGRWMMFYDRQQDLFSGTARLPLERMKNTGASVYRLTVNCRNTKPIAIHTFLLSGAEPCPTSRVDGPKVGVHWYRNDNEQVDALVASLGSKLAEKLLPQDLIVMGPRRLENSSIRAAGGRVGLRIEDGDPMTRPKGVLRYATIPSFKGLEADAVFLVDTDDLDRPERRALAYVGASRARVSLDIFISTKAKAAYQKNASRLADDR